MRSFSYALVAGKRRCATLYSQHEHIIGLTGGGNITNTHARAVRAVPGASVAAIYGTNAGKVRRPAGEYGGQVYAELDAALINQGIHTVDLLLRLLGDVRRVQAAMRTSLHPIEAEDTLAALLEFENGGLGVLQTATSIFPGYPRRIEWMPCQRAGARIWRTSSVIRNGRDSSVEAGWY